MPILVAFMPAMGRFNGVRRATCPIVDLVSLFIDIAFDLGELDATNLVADDLAGRTGGTDALAGIVKPPRESANAAPIKVFPLIFFRNAASFA